MNLKRGHHRVIYKMIATTCLTSLLFIQACDKVFQKISPEELKTLKATCDNLPQPDFFLKVREDSVEKTDGATYGKNYRSKENPEQVKQFYSNALIPQGWRYKVYTDASTTDLDFRKGKYSIVINYQEVSFTSDRLYMVSCSWGVSRNGLIGDLFNNDN